MKKFIVGLKNDWIALLFAVIAILLIIFPMEFTAAIPYMLGLVLIVDGIAGIVMLCKKRSTRLTPGAVVIAIVLGAAILFHKADAVGPIGAIWAMVSLFKVAEEITQSVENKSFSAIQVIVSAGTVALAVMLLFDPFEHFAVHVRILGIEMLLYVLLRAYTLKAGKGVTGT